MNSVLTSSKSILWETSQAFFDEVNATYHFTLDVCDTAENAKCKHFFSLEEDGLNQSWRGRCWMNSLYGREIGKWVEKAYHDSKNGTLVVALLPARPDTRWFHRFIYQPQGVFTQFLEGRLRFSKAKNAAPFPSMLVVFKHSAYAL